MNHVHVGGPNRACTLCFVEVEAASKAAELKAELRSRRFWGWVVVCFSLAFAGVAAFVLFKVGPMGR